MKYVARDKRARLRDAADARGYTCTPRVKTPRLPSPKTAWAYEEEGEEGVKVKNGIRRPKDGFTRRPGTSVGSNRRNLVIEFRRGFGSGKP